MTSRVAVVVAALVLLPASAFVPRQRGCTRPARSALRSADPRWATAADPWDLFKDLHVGPWWGVWETYDQIGDKADVSEILFEAELSPDGEMARLRQTVNVASVAADCETCHDSVETKTFELGAVGRGKLAKNTLVGPALVTGPTVLRSGVMSTELALRHPDGDGRVRVTFQHAPAWQRDNPNPGVGPPDALDLVRVTVRREALRSKAPTAAREQEAEGKDLVPRFWRGVPPFKWAEFEFGNWRGQSWRWSTEDGGEAGGGASKKRPRELDFECEPDVWHERFTGDDENTWHLRLPGGLLLQTPQRLFNSNGSAAQQLGSPEKESSDVYEMRLAWLAEDDVLLRCAARVSAIQTIISDDDSVAVSPPKLEAVAADNFARGETRDTRPFYAAP
eukprot:CAMPEP_0172583798 /NCGR_PEP_ID=MMETSP1068-20121228/3339_1 /TAXON_ID=35684 /ORGANISM="Pseudopedinella elastica, Strain CCMP716" /LENGTH=391 /DNA_ID=CAMNT_0013377715 /DNA_START=22 /DNA_END=1197 /DNA_ORIENTATION=+